MSANFKRTAHLRYRTHATYVFQHAKSGRIHCVKYNANQIEWETFDHNDWNNCQEYMIKNLVSERWGYVDDDE